MSLRSASYYLSLSGKQKKIEKEDLQATLRAYDDMYTNHNANEYDLTPIDDATYDQLVNLYVSLFGAYKKVGHEPSHAYQKKVSLPFWMGSLDKITTEEQLTLFLKRMDKLYPNEDELTFTITDKVDGVSCLLMYPDINEQKRLLMYTRGDGEVGTDISHFYKPLYQADSIVSYKDCDFPVRGEMVMKNKVFETHYQDAKNPRNTTSGIVNAKHPDPEDIKRLSVFVYQIMGTDLPAHKQFKWLEKAGFSTPRPSQLKRSDLTMDQLNHELNERRKTAPYEMDGLVIACNVKQSYPSGENPKHVIAFKNQSETIEATVKQVQWNISKNGLVKPTIELEPVSLKGVTIRYTSGFNANYIQENKIGPGARVLLTRSGDVIPYIVDVLNECKQGWQKPEDYEDMKWNENHIELVMTKSSDEQTIKQMVAFFKCMDSKYLSDTTMKKLYDAGYTSVKKLIEVCMEEDACDRISEIDGFQGASSKRIVKQVLQAFVPKPVYTWMEASCVFPGLGEKKLQLLTSVLTRKEWKTEIKDEDEVRERLQSNKGIKQAADVFIAHWDEWLEWYRELKDYIAIETTGSSPASPSIAVSNASESSSSTSKTSASSSSFHGNVVLFTGFTSKDMEKEIIRQGGEIASSFTKKVNLLVASDLSSSSSKMQRAKKEGIQIMSREELERML